MTDLYKASRIAEQAAYAAGTHLQTSLSRLSATVVTQERPVAVVGAIDREAQALIREVVLRQFPEHGFFADDDAARDHPPDCERPHWVVQPLDGSANYLRGYPQYAVSIALIEGGEPQLGVIYDPCRNEFFGAIRGRGAVLNGVAIRCSKARAPLDSLASTVYPRPHAAYMANYIAELGRVLRGFGGVRRSGSMALELAYLASGRTDAFWEHGMSPQDTAAGILLLRESGALVHARDGHPMLASRSLLACTPTLFEPFLSLLADA